MSTRALTIVVAIFTLLAWDLARNNGEWFWAVNAFVNDLLRGLGLT
jgi:hypothetical protein